jgi:hypothetical protein
VKFSLKDRGLTQEILEFRNKRTKKQEIVVLDLMTSEKAGGGGKEARKEVKRTNFCGIWEAGSHGYWCKYLNEPNLVVLDYVPNACCFFGHQYCRLVHMAGLEMTGCKPMDKAAKFMLVVP